MSVQIAGFDTGLPQPVLNFMIGLTTFLVVGNFVVWLLTFWKPQVFTRVLRRGLSWCPVYIFVFAGLLGGQLVMTALWTLLCLRAMYELIESAPVHPLVQMAQYGAVLLLGAGLMFASLEMFLYILPAALLGALSSWFLLYRKEVVERLGDVVIWWGLVLALGSVVLLCWLPSSIHWTAGLLYLIAIPQLSDVLQYIGGKALGKRPMAPKLSPSKTWEGTLSGVIGSSLVGAMVGPHLLELDHLACFFLALGLCIGGVLGDLLLSAVKRRAGLKDFKVLLSEFGGALDRADSLVLNAPLFLLFILLHGA